MTRKIIATVIISILLAALTATTAFATWQPGFGFKTSPGKSGLTSESLNGNTYSFVNAFSAWGTQDMRWPWGPQMTDEQKAEMKENMEKMKAEKEAREKALADLTDAEKNAIYSINGDIIELQGDLLDKYVEYGLLDEETADKMKEAMSEGLDKMKENGIVPVFGYGFGYGKPCRPSASGKSSVASAQ